MNRRTFIATASAIMALPTRHVFGKIEANVLSGTSFVSDHTGAKIELGRTGLELVAQMLDDETGEEMISFRDDTVHGSVRFVPVGTDTQTYLDKRLAAIDEQSQVAEVLGTDVMDDGGWMALSTLSTEYVNYAFYLEFQLGAFPGYDLEVSMNTSPGAFHVGLEQMQAVLVEGMEPFLFTEESAIDAVEFPFLTGTSSSGSRRDSGSSQSGRSSRGTRSTSSQTETPAGGDEDVVETVRVHQAQFHGELDDLDAILDRITNSPDLEAEALEIFGELDNLGVLWSAYPADAGSLVFPASLSSLEAVYRDWTAAIGDMGDKLSLWSLGAGELDPFLDALDVAIALDTELEVELAASGVSRNLRGVFARRGLRNRVATSSHTLRLQSV